MCLICLLSVCLSVWSADSESLAVSFSLLTRCQEWKPAARSANAHVSMRFTVCVNNSGTPSVSSFQRDQTEQTCNYAWAGSGDRCCCFMRNCTSHWCLPGCYVLVPPVTLPSPQVLAPVAEYTAVEVSVSALFDKVNVLETKASAAESRVSTRTLTYNQQRPQPQTTWQEQPVE